MERPEKRATPETSKQQSLDTRVELQTQDFYGIQAKRWWLENRRTSSDQGHGEFQASKEVVQQCEQEFRKLLFKLKTEHHHGGAIKKRASQETRKQWSLDTRLELQQTHGIQAKRWWLENRRKSSDGGPGEFQASKEVVQRCEQEFRKVLFKEQQDSAAERKDSADQVQVFKKEDQAPRKSLASPRLSKEEMNELQPKYKQREVVCIFCGSCGRFMDFNNMKESQPRYRCVECKRRFTDCSKL